MPLRLFDDDQTEECRMMAFSTIAAAMAAFLWPGSALA